MNGKGTLEATKGVNVIILEERFQFAFIEKNGKFWLYLATFNY